MKNPGTLFRELMDKIVLDDRDEKESMVYLILGELFSLTRANILSGKEINIDPARLAELDKIIQRINDHEPLQYILGTAEFAGRKFRVNPSVLIPRPETEELVRIVEEFSGKIQGRPIRILDIGTGSGCIAITAAIEIAHCEAYASDISPDALKTARENALLHQSEISFMHHDILKQELPYGMFDVIVSNPPYVTESEQLTMGKNILEHEPHLALFVPDNDPLIFYKAIIPKSFHALVRGGLLAVEINERFGMEVKELFLKSNFTRTDIIKDLQGKERIVAGIK